MHDDEDLDSGNGDRPAEPVIAKLWARDEELGRNAEAAWNALTWGQGVASMTQEQVQLFLWYELPLKWLAPPEEDVVTKVAAATAALLDGLGLDRYAAICRSPVTAEVHAAYRRSDDQGRQAFRRAVARSGIDPPDLDDFAWGSMMGTDEACARSTVAMALEQAIAAGELVPGARGWRERQQAVAAGTLDRPHSTLPTQTWRSAILTERLEHWVSFARGRSQGLGVLRARHANRLLPPIPVPDAAADLLAPLRWLLGELETRGGLDLTQTGALNRAFVIEATQRWAWWEYGFRGPNRQDDVWQLGAVHDLVRHCGAARRHRRRLQLTPSGRAMAADPTLAWARVVPWLAGDDDFDQMMAETATLVLLDQESREIATNELWPRVAALAAEHGWRVGGHGGEPPGEREVRWATRPWLRLGGLFALVVEEGDWPSRRIRLTPAGESAMLAYLRSRAAGPRTGLFA
ncbi:MAG TPA: hypothetical protein VM242_08010 [Acidimicrobiales bacterium]|jgi:hypothetical protein|nr:hypothetical protein [Acidimicrobiales bacterium]